jgi:hypothetical protein
VHGGAPVVTGSVGSDGVGAGGDGWGAARSAGSAAGYPSGRGGQSGGDGPAGHCLLRGCLEALRAGWAWALALRLFAGLKGHVGYNTALFSGISARRGGLSTAIEAGVPEAILRMQSGHKTWHGGMSSCAAPSFSIAHGRRSGSSAVVHFQCCNGWLSGSARRPARAPAGPQPGQVLLGDVPGTSALGGADRVGPGPGSGRAGGPEPDSTSGVSTTGRGGGCGASRVRDAGLRPHCSHPLGSLCCCVCLVLVCLLP